MDVLRKKKFEKKKTIKKTRKIFPRHTRMRARPLLLFYSAVTTPECEVYRKETNSSYDRRTYRRTQYLTNSNVMSESEIF